MGKALLAVAAAALLVATACADGAEPAAKHPYMPASLEVPGYVENTLTYATILGVFGVGVAAAIGASLWASRNAKLSALDTATVTWFVCSGLIHLILEGHFAVYNRDLVTRMDFLSQLCTLASSALAAVRAAAAASRAFFHHSDSNAIRLVQGRSTARETLATCSLTRLWFRWRRALRLSRARCAC